MVVVEVRYFGDGTRGVFTAVEVDEGEVLGRGWG